MGYVKYECCGYNVCQCKGGKMKRPEKMAMVNISQHRQGVVEGYNEGIKEMNSYWEDRIETADMEGLISTTNCDDEEVEPLAKVLRDLLKSGGQND